MTIGLTHMALGGALLSCAAGFGGYLHGIDVGVEREQAAQKRAQDAGLKAREEMQDRIDKSAQQHQADEEARRAGIREIYHESEKIIERPVYDSVCVDADGVRLLDRAAAATGSADSAPSAGNAAGPAPGAEK